MQVIAIKYDVLCEHKHILKFYAKQVLFPPPDRTVVMNWVLSVGVTVTVTLAA
jgi:hypothetical protein